MRALCFSAGSALCAVSAIGFFACTVTTNVTSGGDAGTNTDAGTLQDAANGPDSSTIDAADSGPTVTTFLRVAHLSPDGPNFDFCLAPHGTSTFTGPLLAIPPVEAGAPDAATLGLSFGQVMSYVPVAPGQYDLRIVASGSSDCSRGIGADATALPALAANGHATFAVIGDYHVAGSDPAMTVAAYTDDTLVMTSNHAALRFIHAAPSIPAVDFGFGSVTAASFQRLFVNVTFGKTGTQTDSDAGTPDSSGYLSVPGVFVQTFSAHASTGGTTDAVTASSVDIAEGGAATLFMTGGKTADATHPVQFVVCIDNAVTVGPLSSCSFASP